MPLKLANNSKCSLGVKYSNNTSCCGHTPKIFLMSSISLNISMPNTEAFPYVGSNNPVNILIVVVFPAPLCPSKANIYPLYMVMFVLSTAAFLPNTFLSPLIFKHSFEVSYLLSISGMASKSLGLRCS